jgi:hypothetical protein
MGCSFPATIHHKSFIKNTSKQYAVMESVKVTRSMDAKMTADSQLKIHKHPNISIAENTKNNCTEAIGVQTGNAALMEYAMTSKEAQKDALQTAGGISQMYKHHK